MSKVSFSRGAKQVFLAQTATHCNDQYITWKTQSDPSYFVTCSNSCHCRVLIDGILQSKENKQQVSSAFLPIEQYHSNMQLRLQNTQIAFLEPVSGIYLPLFRLMEFCPKGKTFLQALTKFWQRACMLHFLIPISSTFFHLFLVLTSQVTLGLSYSEVEP